MLAAIDARKSRINFETYVFKDGEIGDRFVEALARAAERGVTVRVVIDPVGSVMAAKNRDRLTKAGAKLAWFNPLGFFTVDDRELPNASQDAGRRRRGRRSPAAWAWPTTGSATRRTRSTGATRSSRSPAPRCARSKASFYENWIETGGLSAPALDPELPPRATGARSIVVWSNPMSGASNIKLMYLLAIGAARKTIDIQSPYITLDPSTQWSLDQARKRGVRIRMLAEGRHHRRHAGQARQPLRLSTVCSIKASRSSSTSRR